MPTIIFCEAATGHVLNEDGTTWRKDCGRPMYHPLFDNLEDAKTCKDSLLNKYPFGEVVINDGVKAVVYHDDRLSEYLRERELVYRWESRPFFLRWFCKRPTCEIYRGK